MTNDEGINQCRKTKPNTFLFRHSDFVIDSSLVIRHW
jgi:hypothetical protein